MNAPGGRGETAAVYAAVSTLSVLFGEHPTLQFKSLTIHENGHVEILADGIHGVLKSWAHALPEHTSHPGLVSAFYGAAEADVLESGPITVTVRRPLVGPGGIA